MFRAYYPLSSMKIGSLALFHYICTHIENNHASSPDRRSRFATKHHYYGKFANRPNDALQLHQHQAARPIHITRRAVRRPPHRPHHPRSHPRRSRLRIQPRPKQILVIPSIPHGTALKSFHFFESPAELFGDVFLEQRKVVTPLGAYCKPHAVGSSENIFWSKKPASIFRCVFEFAVFYVIERPDNPIAALQFARKEVAHILKPKSVIMMIIFLFVNRCFYVLRARWRSIVTDKRKD